MAYWCTKLAVIQCLMHTGQEKHYLTKALLIYDGIHYDPLVCQSSGQEVTMFSVDDEGMTSLALNMAQEAQQVTVFNAPSSMYCNYWQWITKYCTSKRCIMGSFLYFLWTYQQLLLCCTFFKFDIYYLPSPAGTHHTDTSIGQYI